MPEILKRPGYAEFKPEGVEFEEGEVITGLMMFSGKLVICTARRTITCQPS